MENTNNLIDITDVDLRDFVRQVYELSVPIGLGFVHYRPDPLTEKEVDDLLSMCASKQDEPWELYMDYIHGRACKMIVWRHSDGRLYIRKRWDDHTQKDFEKLLTRCGVEYASSDENDN